MLDEYRLLRQKIVSQSDIDEIVTTIWKRLMRGQNGYEILRTLLSMSLNSEQRTRVILPTKGEYIEENERVKSIARQKQLIPIKERGNGKW